jgi:hypothetical protein
MVALECKQIGLRLAVQFSVLKSLDSPKGVFMALRHGQNLRPSQNIGETVRTRQDILLRQDLVESRLEEEEEEEQEPNPESPEPPDLEDLGDSEAWLDELPSGVQFDLAWRGSLPLVSALPYRLHPPVRFRIDRDFTVRPLSRRRLKPTEQAIAQAIAQHLRMSGVTLVQPGDWYKIPSIGKTQPTEKGRGRQSDTLRNLAALVPESFHNLVNEERLDKVGDAAKQFGIQLSNGDVITPDALLFPAGDGRRSTRAAALRCASARLEYITNDEKWSAEDWDRFEETQRKKKYSHAKRSRAEGAL